MNPRSPRLLALKTNCSASSHLMGHCFLYADMAAGVGAVCRSGRVADAGLVRRDGRGTDAGLLRWDGCDAEASPVCWSGREVDANLVSGGLYLVMVVALSERRVR